MRFNRNCVFPGMLLGVLLALGSGPVWAADSQGSVQVTFPAGALELSAMQGGDAVLMDGFGRIPREGAPFLPSRIFLVAVPPGALVTGVTFEAEGRAKIEDDFVPAPVPLAQVCAQEDPLLFQMRQAQWQKAHDSVYEGDAVYPAAPCEFAGMTGWRKYNLAQVRISPVQWDPRTKELFRFSQITAHVAYSLPDRLPAGTVLLDGSARTEHAASQEVVNYAQAQTWYPTGAPSRGLYDYVIITLDSLTTAVQPLADWETSKGRTVQVVTTTWIAANYTGYDLAEKMRNFLREKYPSSQWGIEDVCLVGHYDDVPMRRCTQDLGYGKPETDYYYAELSLPDSQSWDKDGDHNWGEDTDPIDFTAEVNVGRIPWSDVTTVTSICNKSVVYEQNADPSFKKNILLLGAFFWADTDNAVLMEYKTNPTNCPWMADWTMTKMYEVGYTTYPCNGDLKWTTVREVWSAGKYGFVNWAGHGSPTGCYIMYTTGEAFVTSATCLALNDAYPAIIFADACSNSDTDSLNLGQAMLKQGGVGFVGATKVALGCPGWKNPTYGSSQSMDFYFTSAVTSTNYTQGAGHQYALRQMYLNGLWDYDKYETFEWGALWGQPDLGMGFVPALSYTFPQGLPEGMLPPGPAHTIDFEIHDGMESYVPGSGRLHYRFDGSDPFTEVAITPLGGNLYRAQIPCTEPGDAPEFYFSAQASGGDTICSPYGAPADTYAFELGFLDVVMKDSFETENGWTVQNTSVITGAFERADPQGTDAQPEDDHTPDGTMCFVTGPLAGSGVGDYDLDGGPTELISPAIDLSGGDAEIGFYTYFYHSTNGTQQPFGIYVSPDGVQWTKVMELTNSPSWTHRSFQVSDFISPTATVKVKFSAIDNPNDSVVEALVDDFSVERIDLDPSLWADAYEASAAAGALVGFSLDAGAANAGRSYLLLGSLSGTSPGIPLPGGSVLPLHWDLFTDIVLMLKNTPAFDGFLGKMDGLGRAQAAFDSFGPLDPAVIGLTAHFAYTLGGPFDFVSNAIPVVFVP